MMKAKITVIKMGEDEKPTFDSFRFRDEVIRIGALQEALRAEDEYINWGKSTDETIFNYAKNAARI